MASYRLRAKPIHEIWCTSYSCLCRTGYKVAKILLLSLTVTLSPFGSKASTYKVSYWTHDTFNQKFPTRTTWKRLASEWSIGSGPRRAANLQECGGIRWYIGVYGGATYGTIDTPCLELSPNESRLERWTVVHHCIASDDKFAMLST